MPVHYIGLWFVLHHSITSEFLPLHLTFKHLKCPEIIGGKVWTVGQMFYRCSPMSANADIGSGL